jgi:hypothetical protein
MRSANFRNRAINPKIDRQHNLKLAIDISKTSIEIGLSFRI